MPAYIGIDPGPSTGISVLIHLPSGQWEIHAFQCTAVSVPMLLGWLIEHFNPKCVAAEAFVASNRAGGKGKQAETTRQVYAQSEYIANRHGVPFVSNPAALAKPWCTDKKLAKINFPLGPKFRDARDSARQGLYASVRYYREKDPLT